jgi:hypothetical protein
MGSLPGAGLLKRCRRGRPIFNEEKIPAAIELAYDLWTCFAPRSATGSSTSCPDSVRSFNTKAASGLAFSEALTTAPVHPTMPGSSLGMEIFPT